MKACRCCGVKKSPREFNRRSLSKDGLRGECKECQSSYNALRYAKSPEFFREKVAQHVAANHEAVCVRRRERYAANPERVLAPQRRYYQLKKAERGAYRREWAKKNPGLERIYSQRCRRKAPEKRAAKTALRNALKKKATPPWADLQAIQRIYKKAADLSKKTGVKFHVDHLVPLAHPLVCGLHCEANLHVLPGALNVAKSNAFHPYEE